MKTPRFWYPSPDAWLCTIVANLLYPLTFLFQAGTRVRQVFAQPYRSGVPLVCVGNVVAGGAGKTPTALALAEILKTAGEKPVFVTRGYGGRGDLTCVDPARHSDADVGDEALLLAAFAPTWAGKDRVKAVREAETNGSIVITDDGLQNPNLKPSSSILVIDAQTGIGNGKIIPAGPLREPFDYAIERATAVVLVGPVDVQGLCSRIEIPVFRAHLEPKLPLGFPKFSRFVAFAGIGRPDKFFATARGAGLDIVFQKEYSDHYSYKESDLEALVRKSQELDAALLTTEKDFVRIPVKYRSEVVVFPVKLVFDTPGAEKMLTALINQTRPQQKSAVR